MRRPAHRPPARRAAGPAPLPRSGMLALVFCGLVMAAGGWACVSARARPAGAFFWRWADWTANVLIFFLSGAIIAAEVSGGRRAAPLRL